MVIKGQSGFGDSIYLYPIVKHYTTVKNIPVTVITNFPKLFTRLPNIKTEPHTKRTPSDLRVSYSPRKYTLLSNQYQDYCYSGGVDPPPPFTLDWKCTVDLRKELNIPDNKKIAIVSAPYIPFNRTDGYGHELRIDYAKMQYLLDIMKNYFIIQVGLNVAVHQLQGIDHYIQTPDYIRTISIYDNADMIIGQVGHSIPMAEALDKKAMIIYSVKGLQSKHVFINSITPQKIHSKKTTGFIYDNMNDNCIKKRFNELEDL